MQDKLEQLEIIIFSRELHLNDGVCSKAKRATW